MAHQVGKQVQKGWEWLTPSGSTKWLSHDPSKAREARQTAGKGLKALEEYEAQVEGRKGDIEGYYDEQRELLGQEYDVRSRGIGLQQERLGLQESQNLTQFLGDAYSFRKQSEVEKATGGLYSSEAERMTGRKRATMSDMMQGRQEQLDISGRELGLQSEGMGIAQARSLADLLKSQGIELSGIEDLLYQIETERISYEGV
jgi:hypothetical protein